MSDYKKTITFINSLKRKLWNVLSAALFLYFKSTGTGLKFILPIYKGIHHWTV